MNIDIKCLFSTSDYGGFLYLDGMILHHSLFYQVVTMKYRPRPKFSFRRGFCGLGGG